MKVISEKKIPLFYVLFAAFLVSGLVVYYFNARKVKSATISMDHTQEVINTNNSILLDILNIETSGRGYAMTGNKKFSDPHYAARISLSDNLAKLSALYADSPDQQSNIGLLKEKTTERVAIAALLIETTTPFTAYEKEKIILLEKGEMLTTDIRKIILDMNTAGFRLLNESKSENEENNKNAELLFLFLLIYIVLASFLIFFLIRIQRIRGKEMETLAAAQKLLSGYSLSLIEASPDPLFTINSKGVITDTNEASVKVTEVLRKDLIGSDFVNYFTDHEKARIVYQTVFEKGAIADYPLVVKDGVLMNVLFNGSVYKDTDGNVLGAVLVAHDITEQKRTEKELTEAKVFAELATAFAEEAKLNAETATRTANDAVKAKQQFLSNMSHEIRTPMNAIIGFTKVLLKTDMSAKQREYLSAIKISGDALIVLINDILDLAKVDSGKMSFEHIPFRMAASVGSMLHLFDTKIQEKNLKLIKEYDPRIPDVLVGDPLRLHQIILNLLSNAVKFTNEGEVSLAVRLLNETPTEVTIEFVVSDTGIGIPANRLSTIFENFQQASSSTSRLFGGTGLGLAIVKQLVEQQGGSVSVESKPGAGAAFRFILIFQKTNAKVEIESEMIERDADIKNIKVLVVEDMALNQLLMKTLLDDFGFEREIAANGKIAIEKLEARSYDIILMDLQMPEMNGFEATEYIRKKMNSKIPIIALTADVTTVDIAKCKAVGMNDYISKPVDERILYNKIVGLVRKTGNEKMVEAEIKNEELLKKIKFVDLSYLNQRTKSNPALMREMISLYLEQTPPLVSSMKQSLANKDWQLLHATVHKMIPSFSIMGINPDFENMAKKIQEFARIQEWADEIHPMVLELENVCLQACKELEEVFESLPE